MSTPRRFAAVTLVALSSLGASLAVDGGVQAAPATQAAQAARPARVFKNCTEMHKVYRGGVAKIGARDRRPGGGTARYAPKRSNALYFANSKSDRDKDGVACER